VTLIGPESTGKTWLARDLAVHYGVPWSPEFARAYVDDHPDVLSYADVDAIGHGQRQTEDDTIDRAARARASLVILDTDLVSTSVYSQHYFGSCPDWIERAARDRLADLYLLHHVDVAWTADGQQRQQPSRRVELFERFRDALGRLGARVVDVQGSWHDRRRRAIDAVDGRG